jgi:hypothetical protein
VTITLLQRAWEGALEPMLKDGAYIYRTAYQREILGASILIQLVRVFPICEETLLENLLATEDDELK